MLVFLRCTCFKSCEESVSGKDIKDATSHKDVQGPCEEQSPVESEERKKRTPREQEREQLLTSTSPGVYHTTAAPEDASQSLSSEPSAPSESAALQSKLQVPFSELTFHVLIGKGSFKQVYRGKWNNTNVAIVAMRRGGLVTEARLLQQLGAHPNLVQFYRWSTDQRGNEYIIVELVTFGSLDKVLAQFGPSLRNRSKLLMCEQVCHAMCELAAEGVLHRDLAARNILVQSMQPVHVKVADFGLARVAPHSNEPHRTAASSGDPGACTPDAPGSRRLSGKWSEMVGGAEPEEAPLVPVRWSAPEVLRSGGGWSEKSDVYSYGVTMWEIFSNGAEPYASRSDQEAAADIAGGDLLPRPKNCPHQVYSLMTDCWRSDPTERPTFRQIANVYRRWREVTMASKAAGASAHSGTSAATSEAGGMAASSPSPSGLLLPVLSGALSCISDTSPPPCTAAGLDASKPLRAVLPAGLPPAPAPALAPTQQQLHTSQLGASQSPQKPPAVCQACYRGHHNTLTHSSGHGHQQHPCRHQPSQSHSRKDTPPHLVVGVGSSAAGGVGVDSGGGGGGGGGGYVAIASVWRSPAKSPDAPAADHQLEVIPSGEVLRSMGADVGLRVSAEVTEGGNGVGDGGGPASGRPGGVERGSRSSSSSSSLTLDDECGRAGLRVAAATALSAVTCRSEGSSSAASTAGSGGKGSACGSRDCSKQGGASGPVRGPPDAEVCDRQCSMGGPALGNEGPSAGGAGGDSATAAAQRARPGETGCQGGPAAVVFAGSSGNGHASISSGGPGRGGSGGGGGKGDPHLFGAGLGVQWVDDVVAGPFSTPPEGSAGDGADGPVGGTVDCGSICRRCRTVSARLGPRPRSDHSRPRCEVLRRQASEGQPPCSSPTFASEDGAGDAAEGSRSGGASSTSGGGGGGVGYRQSSGEGRGRGLLAGASHTVQVKHSPLRPAISLTTVEMKRHAGQQLRLPMAALVSVLLPQTEPDSAAAPGTAAATAETPPTAGSKIIPSRTTSWAVNVYDSTTQAADMMQGTTAVGSMNTGLGGDSLDPTASSTGAGGGGGGGFLGSRWRRSGGSSFGFDDPVRHMRTLLRATPGVSGGVYGGGGGGAAGLMTGGGSVGLCETCILSMEVETAIDPMISCSTAQSSVIHRVLAAARDSSAAAGPAGGPSAVVTGAGVQGPVTTASGPTLASVAGPAAGPVAAGHSEALEVGLELGQGGVAGLRSVSLSLSPFLTEVVMQSAGPASGSRPGSGSAPAQQQVRRMALPLGSLQRLESSLSSESALGTRCVERLQAQAAAAAAEVYDADLDTNGADIDSAAGEKALSHSSNTEFPLVPARQPAHSQPRWQPHSQPQPQPTAQDPHPSAASVMSGTPQGLASELYPSAAAEPRLPPPPHRPVCPSVSDVSNAAEAGRVQEMMALAAGAGPGAGVDAAGRWAGPDVGGWAAGARSAAGGVLTPAPAAQPSARHNPYMSIRALGL